jgi:hypothetical protein
LRQYRTNLLDGRTGTINAMVRLRHGEADIPALRRRLGRSVNVDDLLVRLRLRERGTEFEARCLFAFAAAAALAGVVLLG